MNQTYTPSERLADGIIHALGICVGLVAVIAMMAAAIPSLPFFYHRKPCRLRRCVARHVWFFGSLQPSPGAKLEKHPAPLGSSRYLPQDRRYVHTIRTDQDGRVGRLHIAKRGMVRCTSRRGGKAPAQVQATGSFRFRSHIPRPRRVDAALKPPHADPPNRMPLVHACAKGRHACGLPTWGHQIMRTHGFGPCTHKSKSVSAA